MPGDSVHRYILRYVLVVLIAIILNVIVSLELFSQAEDQSLRTHYYVVGALDTTETDPTTFAFLDQISNPPVLLSTE